MKTGWVVKKLSEVCDKITDGTHQTPTYYENGIIFLSSRNVTSGKIDWENIKYIDKKQHDEMHRRVAPRINDILLAKNGTTGVAALVDRDITFDIYVSLAILRPLDLILPSFLLYFINSPVAKKQFNKRLKGMGVPNLHLEEIREVIISFPKSLHEQRDIVAKLDELFTAIDQAKANTERNLANAKEILESYLNNIFASPGKDWEEKKLIEICTIKPPKKEARDKLKDSDFVTFLPMEDLGVLNKEVIGVKKRRFKEVEGSYTYFADNDVLLAKITPCFENGKIGIAHNLLNGIGFGSSEYIVFRPNRKVTSEYLFYFLSRNKIRVQGSKLMTGAVGHKRVSKDWIENYTIPFPKNLAEQEIIVQKIEALSANLNKIESNYHQKLNDLEELKKSILQKTFAGELNLSTEKITA